MLIDLNRLFIDEGTHVLVGEPTFSSATTDMRAMGAQLTVVALREEERFRFSVARFIEALRPEHTLVYLDNPNNPTGQMNKYPNVIVVKTLSKGFGLAGLRTGYAVLPQAFMPIMRKLPAEMVVTETAARLTPIALRDREHIARSREQIAANKARLLESLSVLQGSVTGDTVPIVLLYTERDLNLFDVMLRHGIITERGEDFDGIGKRHIRLRVPRDLTELLPRLAAVEKEVEGASCNSRWRELTSRSRSARVLRPARKCCNFSHRTDRRATSARLSACFFSLRWARL